MRKAKVLIGLLAAPLLALGTAAPAATAAPLAVSAPAVHAAPDLPALNNCNIYTHFCYLLDLAAAHPRYLTGTAHNLDLYGSLSGTLYTAISLGNGWHWITGENGLCWNLDMRHTNAEIAMDSCQVNDPNEEWNFVDTHFIENARAGTHWAVQCCQPPNVAVMANGYTNGTELWYGVT